MNYRGTVVLDAYVQPTMEVTDYRTSTTGIEAKHLLPGERVHLNLADQLIQIAYTLISDSAMPFNTVQSMVGKLCPMIKICCHSNFRIGRLASRVNQREDTRWSFTLAGPFRYKYTKSWRNKLLI